MSWWGEFGTLFFIYISIWNIKPAVSIVKYMINRYFRLYPTYFIAIILIYLLSLFFPLGERSVDFITFLQNLTMLNGFWGVEYVDGAHWYITMLLSASLFVVIIETKCGTERRKQVAFLLWLLIGFFIRFVKAPVIVRSIFTVGYIGTISFIASVKRLSITIAEKRKVPFDFGFFTELFIIILSMSYMASLRGIRYCIMMAMACCIYLFCVYEKMKIFDNVVLKWVGMISYPLYLIHQNISYMVINLLYNYFGKQFYIIYYLVAILVSTMLGVILFYFWDKPIAKIINQLMGKKQ